MSWAYAGETLGVHVIDSVDIRKNPERLESGRWFVTATFEGTMTAWRFALNIANPANMPSGGRWVGPRAESWTSSLDQKQYQDRVAEIRRRIRDGDVYQANLCRTLYAPLCPPEGEPDAYALSVILRSGNPAPYAAAIHIPTESGHPSAWIVSASPELFVRRSGDLITSAPIKGTAKIPEALKDKDRTENIMIVDMVRNDLQRICEPGGVQVPGFLTVERHPGLVHLVSTVQGTLRKGITWADIFLSMFPPASVSGTPKPSALSIIQQLEPVSRGPYCGAIGWIDGDANTAQLAVGIRTFWWRDGMLRFGTGAGITWASDPASEWAETQLKASHLIQLASGKLAI